MESEIFKKVNKRIVKIMNEGKVKLRIETVSIDKLVVSPQNIRVNEEFGLTRGGEVIPEDEALMKNVKREDVKQLITVRPNRDSYEVVMGRRRFLALKETGVREVQCIVRDLDDREALKASLIENLKIYQKGLDPVTRARALNRLISISPTGMVGIARELGVPKSTLSEWLRVLDLSPKTQELVSLGRIPFRDALGVARLELGLELQDSLAEMVETKGKNAFKKELARLNAGRGKRGLPKGVYEIDRVLWDRRNRREMGYYKTLERVAETKGMTVSEYIKDYLIRHIEDIKGEIA